MSLTQVSGNMIASNTTFSNIVASNGLYSVGNYNGSFSGGIVVDYVSGNGRISVGSADALTIYNGGVASTALMKLDANGNLGLGVTPSGWSSGLTAFDLGATGSLFSVNNQFTSTYNAYFVSPNWVYKTTRFATQYAQGAGEHRWYNAPSGTAGAAISFTQAMTLDASGNLGIGTSSPSTYGKLAVQVSTPSAAAQSAYLAGTDGTKTFILNQNGSSYSYAGSGANELWFYLNGSYSAMTFGSDGAVPIKFISSGSERMRIDSSGNLLVGATSQTGASEKLLVSTSLYTALVAQNTNASLGSDVFQVNVARNTVNGSYRAITYYNSGASSYRFIVYDSGSILSLGSYNNTTASGANMTIISDGNILRSTSSARYKNTIKDAVHGLAEVLKLRSVTYKGNNDGDTVFGGLIAEEVHDAGLTEFVQYNDDGEPDALSYGNMVALAFKAIQELSAELNELKQKVK